MSFPIEVTFRNMDHSAAVEDRIRAEAAKLRHLDPRITQCQVVVEAPHRHQVHGQLYHIEIKLHTPGGNVVVNHEPKHGHEVSDKLYARHKDIDLSIHDAFDVARRQLHDFLEKRREEKQGAHPAADSGQESGES